MKLINMTPHTVHFNKKEISSQGVARVATIRNSDDGMFVTETFGEVEGLPPEEEGVLYIVSSIVFAATSRKDVCVPTDFVRDENGAIVGCSRFRKK